MNCEVRDGTFNAENTLLRASARVPGWAPATLSSTAPVTRTPALVGYRKNADLFADHRIDDAKGKAPRDESTSAMAPDRPEARVL
jgi:hypothetical protein